MSDEPFGDLPDADVPHDVRAALSQLLERARDAANAGDTEAAAALLDTAGTVAENKLPPGERRDRIRRGCETAHRALPDDDLAAAYAAAALGYVPEA